MRYGGVDVDSKFIDEEDIVAKLHFLEQMEERWPYAPAKGVLLADRVRRSLSFVPEELQRYALVAFANVMYLPDSLLRESWGYLARYVARGLRISTAELFDQSHLLEVDSGGNIPAFLHENSVQGRLDTDRFSRLNSVTDLATNLRLVAGSNEPEEEIVRAIRLAFSKRYWLLLSDNVLSGTSVRSDLSRCQRLISAYRSLGEPRLVPVTQVLTSTAEEALSPESLNYFALRFDGRSRVVEGNATCGLFNSQATLAGVVRVSNWLADQTWFAEDVRLKATIEKSGDNMACGFKNGGWTIVTPNCPTNSLPILWYDMPGFYEGPFPRIMSRTTQAKGGGESLAKTAIDLAPQVLEKLQGGK